jgi:hypothetical protein
MSAVPRGFGITRNWQLGRWRCAYGVAVLIASAGLGGGCADLPGEMRVSL